MTTPFDQLVTMAETMAEELEKWAEKAKEDHPTPDQIATDYFTLKTKYEQFDKARKRVYAVVDMLNKFLVPTILEENNMDMIRVPHLARSFGLRTMTSASMIDKEEGVKWLRNNGHGDLVQETVNAGTLASFAKNLMIEEGIDLPEDIFKVASYKTTGVTKYTPK